MPQHIFYKTKSILTLDNDGAILLEEASLVATFARVVGCVLRDQRVDG